MEIAISSYPKITGDDHGRATASRNNREARINAFLNLRLGTNMRGFGSGEDNLDYWQFEEGCCQK